MAAAKPIIPLLRLAVGSVGGTRATKATFSSTSPIFTNSSRRNTEPLPRYLLPFSRESRAYLLFHRSFRLSRTSCNSAQSKRSFSSSPTPKAVAATINPRKDEEGNDMLIDITSRAATRLQEIMFKDSNPKLALRVRVESGGCHGFQYLMSLTNTSDISPEDDTVFEATDSSGARVVMDEPSLELLKGSKIDYTTELIGSQFKIVGNPAATSSCGCGTSFDIKG